MSRVLKRDGQTGAGDIRPLSAAWDRAAAQPAPVSSPVVDPEILSLREERDLMLRRIEQQASVLRDLRTQADMAFQKGEAAGREAGRREAEDRSTAMLARLDGGIRQATEIFTQSLTGLERLAPALAREGLATVLGAADDRADLVAAVVMRHLRTLEAQAIVEVEVSPLDFGDAAALSSLRDKLDGVLLNIQARPGLKSGDCRIRLKLGTLEVGLDQQWGRLSALLEQMAEPGGHHV